MIPLHKRAAYMGIFGSVFGLASVVGPLIGDLQHEKENKGFTDHIYVSGGGFTDHVWVLYTTQLAVGV